MPPQDMLVTVATGFSSSIRKFVDYLAPPAVHFDLRKREGLIFNLRSGPIVAKVHAREALGTHRVSRY